MTSFLLSTWLSLQALDMTTTCQALNKPNTYEANSLLPDSCLKIATVKTGLAGLESYSIYKLSKHHSKLAKGLMLVGIGSSSYAVIHNYRLSK